MTQALRNQWDSVPRDPHDSDLGYPSRPEISALSVKDFDEDWGESGIVLYEEPHSNDGDNHSVSNSLAMQQSRVYDMEAFAIHEGSR